MKTRSRGSPSVVVLQASARLSTTGARRPRPNPLRRRRSPRRRPWPRRPEPPRILHPVPEPPASATPLPAARHSDVLAGQTAAGLVGRDAFVRLVLPDDLVRRFVATVDNLPRKTTARGSCR